jgi:hypothetical protein
MTLVRVTLPLDFVMEKSGVSLRLALPDRIHSRRRTTKINFNFPFFIRPDRMKPWGDARPASLMSLPSGRT